MVRQRMGTFQVKKCQSVVLETPKLPAITLYTGLYTIEVFYTLELIVSQKSFFNVMNEMLTKIILKNIGSIHAYGQNK